MSGIHNEVPELQILFCPFGFLDLKRVCSIGDDVWLSESELFEIIETFRESIGFSEYNDIDPVYCVLEHVLQMSRNSIEKLSGYDFINDFSGIGSEIYTYGNYMCSSYDYSEEASQELKDKALPYLDKLSEDNFCRYFFDELDIRAD